MMSEKRFEWIDKDTISDNQTDEWYCFLFDDIRDDFVDLLNELNDENKTLKAQLYCESSVCNICKHQQLTPYKGMRGYYTSKCEKGHKECSKEDLKHCKDFKLEGLSE